MSRYLDDCPDGNIVVKSNVRFMDLPRKVRKSELVSVTDHYRFTMKEEPDHKRFTYKMDYKYVAWLIIFAESHINWNLLQDEDTQKILLRKKL
jgi:hypothetical protein